MTNYIIDTMVDPATGKTTVSVTTYGPQGEAYQDRWVSNAVSAAVAGGGGVMTTSPSINLNALDVVAEATVAGAQLAAAVAAGTQAPGALVEANPDPMDT
jgi:hypothetical protein